MGPLTGVSARCTLPGMRRPHPPREASSAIVLSGAVAALMAVASAGGLFLDGLYRDNLWVTTQLRGNDLVTLAVAAPALAVGMYLSARGSVRGELVWVSMLAYALYNYAFYLFGASFNVFFLLYAALVSLPVFAGVAALRRLDVEGLARRFSPRTPVRAIGGWLLFVAVGLGAVWIAMTLRFVFAGVLPPVIEQAGSHTSIVFALDLSLLVPAMALGGVWLWQRRPWGYVLGTVMAVKGATYTLALAAMAVFAGRAGVPGSWELLPLWAGLSAVTGVAAGLLLAGAGPPPGVPGLLDPRRVPRLT